MGRYKQINLSKGAKLYYVKNNITKSTAVKIVFACGSRVDTIPGLAHFTEHMFFTGTKTMTKEQVTKKYFDFIGTNAATSSKEIFFDGNVFTKEFEEYVKTVAMLITESTFKQKEIDKEIPVVQQEIARKKDKFNILATNKNLLNITNLCSYDYYGALGTEESVASIKSKDVKNYVKKYFIANNMKVYITSPLSLNKVKSIIEKHLVSKLPVDEKFEKLHLFEDYVKNETFKHLESKNIGKNYIYINFKNDHNLYDFKYRAKVSLLLDMMNDVATGVMKMLREERSLVYSSRFYTDFRNDKESLISFYTECATKNVNPVIETIAEYFEKVAKNGFTEDQLKQAKRSDKYNQDTKEPTVYRDLWQLKDFDYYGRVLKREIPKLMKKVTLEECNELFKEIFLHNKISYTVYGDIKKEDLISDKKFDELFIKN